MLDEDHKALRLLIFGRVQGVFFRDWTIQTASELNLDGWVRNRSDGTVEALIVGENNAVDKMVEKCWTGPKMAKVDNIETSAAKGIVKNGFEQKPTVNMKERRGE